MSAALKALEQHLDRIVEERSATGGILGKPEVMAKTLQDVKAIFDTQASAHPPEDRILNAVTTFIQSNSYQDEYHARLITWGLALPRRQSKALIELEISCPILLSKLQKDLQQDMLTAKVWRGLLSSYFAYLGPYSSDPNGRTNWMALRAFLRDSFHRIYERKPYKPEWMRALFENQNLLEDTPCAQYVDNTLQGDDGAIKRLKESLLIPETSWVMAEIVRAKVERACSNDDASFKRSISQLCELLRDHELYSNTGLIAVLTRYYALSDTSENRELGTLAVDLWGNPKLPLSHRWSQVSPDVKRMVLKWLISKDLTIFFDLFSKDHDADQDKRRLKFWMRYLDHISDAYFVLGSHAANSFDADYVEMRHSNKGRICLLEQGGSPKNNAFVMLIDRYAIVEFGRTGNACFCFDLDNLPFRLESPRLRGDSSQLKHASYAGCKFRLTHNDGHMRWEGAFEEELGKLGIIPGSVQSHDFRRKFRIRSEPGRHSQNARAVDRPPNGESFSMDELKDFVGRFELEVYDLRPKGGNLWVKPDIESIAVARQLEKWGLRRKLGKGWWLA